MSIILEILTFLVVIIILILVHEFGHFIVAKLSGMRVDEFGIGYPPRALLLGKIGETEYTLNWLPFGGFVRIYGEDGLEEVSKEHATDSGEISVEPPRTGEEHPEAAGVGMAEAQVSPGIGTTVATHRAFGAKARILQALTLVAGIAMNLLFAYLLLTATLIMGTTQALSPDQMSKAQDVRIAISEVVPGSPAAQAGFKAGDEIIHAGILYPDKEISYDQNNPAELAALIATDTDLAPMTFSVLRGDKPLTVHATPALKSIPGAPSKPGLGFALTAVGTIKTPLAEAPLQGALLTWEVTKETAVGLYNLFKGLLTFTADLSQVSGPIGIAGAVGHASATSLAALLSLTALISVNLALVNLIPIPALDGGRLLFVIIEAIIRRPLNPKIAGRVNAVGFGLLLLLMVVISAHDILNLFHH